jgi:hypothetical protein
MNGDRYALLVLAKGATVHECQDCGAITFHRIVHDAWHVMAEREATAVAAILARLVARTDGHGDRRRPSPMVPEKHRDDGHRNN